MYRRIVCVIMILLIAGVAQAGGRKVVGLSVGMGFPQSPEYVQDFWKNGLGGAVSVGITPGLPELTLYFMAETHYFPFDEHGIIEMLPISDSVTLYGNYASASSALVMLKMNIMPPAPGISPYLTAGVGLADVDIPVTVIEFTGQKPQQLNPGTKGTGRALSFGAGIDAYFNPDFGLFVEIRYMKVFVEPYDYDIEYLPIQLGVIIAL